MSPTARVAAATALGAVVVVGALLISRTSSNVGQAPASPSQPAVVQPSTTPAAVAPSPSAINVLAGYTQLPGWIVSATSALNIDFLTKLDIGSYVQRSNFLIFGIILAGIMLLRPQGLLPSAQRKVELEGGTSDEAVADLRGSA